MDRLLLTGAGGWIGSHCIDPLLARNYEIHGLCRSAAGADPRVRWHSCDLLSGADRRRVIEKIHPSHLLHLAWDVQPGYRTAAGNWDWLTASVDLFAHFVQAGGRRIVGAGTCLEYDWSSGICREGEAVPRPSTPYGRAKLALAHTLSAANISSAWGRVFFSFGPGEAAGRLIPSVVTSLLSGCEAQCTAGTQARDFLYVRDLGHAFAALVDSDVTGPVNLASGRSQTIKELVLAFADRMGRGDQVRFGARPTAGDDVHPRLDADVSCLRNSLNFKESWNPDQAMDETIAFWRSFLRV